MRGKKTLLARMISVSGMVGPVALLRSLLRKEIVILAYHRVLDSWNEETFEFDPDLISASASEFRWQMSYIRQHYTPVTFRQVLDHLDGVFSLPSRPIIVTFDDGFDDNYLHAYPILRALNVPATIFVSTGYIGQSRTFWFDWLFFLCNKAASSGIPVRMGSSHFHLSADIGVRRIEIARILSHVKRLPDAELRSELEKLEQQLGLELPATGFPQSRPLSWAQVREMGAHGIEFGSHTVTHPILANLTQNRLSDELTESKVHLEREIERAVEVIAYPVGGKFAFNSAVVDAVRNAGYRIATSYIPGINGLQNLELFSLRRLRVERYTTRDDFKGMLVLPELLS